MKSKSYICAYCNESFMSIEYTAKYCSMACTGKARTANVKPKQPNVSCAWCQKPFYKRPSAQRYSKSGLYFCSREHKDQAQNIDGLKLLHLPHYGTGNGGSSYRERALKRQENKCEKCGYSKYIEVLQVHHKDRDRKNNIQTNLSILCPTCHIEEHFLTSTGPYSKNKQRKQK